MRCSRLGANEGEENYGEAAGDQRPRERERNIGYIYKTGNSAEISLGKLVYLLKQRNRLDSLTRNKETIKKSTLLSTM